MRLTLRTLLAYVDDILEPEDHEDLGKKIESSDFATELIHRSRDTVRRLRLGAPAVLAEDSQDVLGDEADTADANTVSEYLDNTLSPERVAEFERICLEPGTEADMHLAEVASCHHVLTMVLGEPAEIETSIRDRMYRLPEEAERTKSLRIEPAHQAPPVEQPAAPRPQVPIAPVPPSYEYVEEEAEVPDYLRAATAERHHKLRLVAAACIVAMFGALGYFLFRPVAEPELPEGVASVDMQSIESGPAIEIESVSEPEPQVETNDSSAPPFVPETDSSETTGEGEGSADDATSSGEAEEKEVDSPSAGDLDSTNDAVAASQPDSVVPGVSTATSGADGDSSTSSPLDGDPLAEATPDAPLPPQTTDPVRPILGVGSDRVATDDALTDDFGVGGASSVPPPPEPEGPVQMGNYLSVAADILLRRDFETGKWIRMPPRTAITGGDHLLTLPTFRPHISLQEMNIYLAGGTRVQILDADQLSSEGGVGLDVLYGRLLINAGLDGGPLLLKLGEDTREMKLGGSASLAVKVRRVFVPGSNFETEVAPIEVDWYLTSGSVQWPGLGGGKQTIEAPSAWKTIEGIDELPSPIEELPVWIDHEEVTDIERRAKKALSEQLVEKEPVEITLLELNDPAGLGRRREVRTLAAKSSLHVGQFEPFVKSLSDVDQRKAWDDHIDSLRAAIALSPKVAAQVRDAFETLRGREATQDLMEMVQGYSDQEVGLTAEQQQNGALVKLLGWLDNESLDYRVLATYNLNQITGSTYKAGYRPEADSSQRQRALRKLWNRFESNDLMPAGS